MLMEFHAKRDSSQILIGSEFKWEKTGVKMSRASRRNLKYLRKNNIINELFHAAKLQITSTCKKRIMTHQK